MAYIFKGSKYFIINKKIKIAQFNTKIVFSSKKNEKIEIH